MQPYFVPYIGYFQLIHAVDVFILYNDVNFINRGWINRNRILINGAPHYIALQLSQASQNKLINEISIIQDKKNREKIYRTIQLNYAKAPQFKAVMPLVERIIFNPEEKLDTYLAYSLKEIAEYAGIKTQFIQSSDIKKIDSLKGQDKIIAIAKQCKADVYINAIGGQEMYDRKMFEENGMDLKFIKTDEIIYSQFQNTFVPHLSIIDVMMFNSQNALKSLLAKYTFI